MKLSEKKLILITLGIWVILILGLGGTGYWLTQKLKKAQSDLVTIQRKIETNQQQLEIMKKLQQDVSDLEIKKEKVEILLPSAEELSEEEFIQTLNQFAGESNIIILNANIIESSRLRSSSEQGSTLPAGLEEMSYELKLEGEFYNLITFIWRLESYRRFIKVDRFDVTPKDPSKLLKGQTKYIMNLVVTSYTYKAETLP